MREMRVLSDHWRRVSGCVGREGSVSRPVGRPTRLGIVLLATLNFSVLPYPAEAAERRSPYDHAGSCAVVGADGVTPNCSPLLRAFAEADISGVAHVRGLAYVPEGCSPAEFCRVGVFADASIGIDVMLPAGDLLTADAVVDVRFIGDVEFCLLLGPWGRTMREYCTTRRSPVPVFERLELHGTFRAPAETAVAVDPTVVVRSPTYDPVVCAAASCVSTTDAQMTVQLIRYTP